MLSDRGAHVQREVGLGPTACKDLACHGFSSLHLGRDDCICQAFHKGGVSYDDPVPLQVIGAACAAFEGKCHQLSDKWPSR